jgi:site-specific recombinase XerD
MNRNLKYWAKIAGIDKNLTLHTARHTFCTWLLTKGVDLYTVSQLAGHTNIKTTQIYAKIVDEKKRAAVSLLDD